MNVKLIIGIILGIIATVVVFCAVVGVGCAVNGLTFGEQIVEWFGTSAPVVEDVVEETAARILL